MCVSRGPTTYERRTNLIARVASGFEYRFSDFAKFNQDVTVLAGEDNTEVPVGTENTDTYTSVNLVYNFE